MDFKAFQAEKQRMKQIAEAQISEAEQRGEQERAQISMLKQEAVHYIDTRKQGIIKRIDAETQEAIQADKEAAEKRADLVRQLTDAAQKGDLTEMKRIRQLMDGLKHPD